MITKLMTYGVTMILTLVMLAACVTPTAPGPGESPLEPTPTPVQEIKIGYVENRDQLIIGDGMGAMPGLAIELINQIFPDVPTESFKDDERRLYEAVAAGEVTIALGLPRPFQTVPPRHPILIFVLRRYW